MSFSSVIFLFYFFPLFLIFYYAVPGKIKLPLLLAGSYLFFLWGTPVGATVLFLSTVLDYFFGHAVGRADGHRKKRVLMSLSVAVNVLILIYFKYSNFFVGEINRFLQTLGASAIHWTAVIFPLGISFITFHKISYIVDIYYGRAEPSESFVSYALYLAMFPKLIMGPIVLYHDMESQLKEVKYTFDDIYSGLIRFSIGFARKILLADPMGTVADKVFGMDLSNMTVGYSWLGILCYTFQIYFDFAGYTDMAIGIGRMLGFKIKENFNRPLYSQSFTEHWKRWHITLGDFFRQYLYIPLGGNRGNSMMVYRNLWIVFLLSGLWHGANWTYIVWGIYHGFFMSLDRLFLTRALSRFPKALKIAFFFVALMVGFVFFRSDSIGGAARYICRMFEFTAVGSISSKYLWVNLAGNREMFIILVCGLISFFPESLIDRIRSFVKEKINPAAVTGFTVAGVMLLIVLSIMSLINNSFNPFIYFRF